MCSTYIAPSLLPTSRNQEVSVPQTINRVPGGADAPLRPVVKPALPDMENE
jgi:hypothetical protein